jgi:hypothetical protein
MSLDGSLPGCALIGVSHSRFFEANSVTGQEKVAPVEWRGNGRELIHI